MSHGLKVGQFNCNPFDKIRNFILNVSTEYAVVIEKSNVFTLTQNVNLKKFSAYVSANIGFLIPQQLNNKNHLFSRQSKCYRKICR